MTKKEVSAMLNFAMSCYPGAQIKEPAKMLEVWTRMFETISADSANQAMKEACCSSKYFPSVAEVMTIIKAENDRMRGYVKC